MTVRAHSIWPRCRQKKNRTIVSGRYIGLERWLATKSLIGMGVTGIGLVLLAAGALPLVYSVEEIRTGTAVTPLSSWLSALRGAAFRLANEDFPQIGKTLRYRKPSRYDVHFLALGVTVLVFRRWLRVGVAVVLTTICWPLVSRRIHVVFTERWITVCRWFFWRTRFPRSGEMTSFRAVDLQEARPWLAYCVLSRPGEREPVRERPRVAQLVYGFRTVNLASPVTGSRTAERIVEALHYAQRKTKPGQFPATLAHR